MLKLGLRTKFFLYSNTLIVVTMSLVTVLAVAHERHVRYDAIDKRGRSLTEALAIPIADALAYADRGPEVMTELTEDYIAQILERNRDFMRYVVVSGPEGRVTHSNRAELLGRPFERALGRDASGRPTEVETRDEPGQESILEVRTTLDTPDGFRGSLAVGFSLEPIERQVAIITRQAVVIALLLMVGNSALTAIYVETLIRPILNLHQTMKWAGAGDFTVRARTRRRDEVGELAGAFNRMMDELEEAREREKAQRTQLAHTEKMAAVGTLAAGVAHEVNNPLGGILTCIENMRAHPEDREMRERYLELIHDGIERIERTVANLLGFARQRTMRLEPTSINHNLRHVVELVEYQLRQGQITVALDLDPDEPYVMADHFQMEQLFLNLTLNALRAMPEGGTLTLATRKKDGRLIVEVRDTGTGIAEEIRERIFDPFFTTREVGEGTGLGLAVSDSIVAAHGGAIEVESDVGKGSVFRVSFSVVDALGREEHVS